MALKINRFVLVYLFVMLELVHRFSQKFADKVANEDIVLFKRTPIKREDGAEIDADEIEQLIMDQDVNHN